MPKKSRPRQEHRTPRSSGLRQFDEVHIDEHVGRLKGDYENALFFNCTFDSLDGLTLKNCVLDKSTVTARNPSDLLGLTVTLDCHSFSNVGLTEEAFDMLLLLLCKTRGNEAKRRTIIEKVVGHENAVKYLRLMKTLETQ